MVWPGVMRMACVWKGFTYTASTSTTVTVWFAIANKSSSLSAALIMRRRFCGNHKPASAESRIPCPIDPSHTILHEDMAAHIKKCPLVKQVADLKLKPYYQKGINAGSDEEDSSKYRSHGRVCGSNCSLPRSTEEFWMGDIEGIATFEGIKAGVKDIHSEEALWENSVNSSYADDIPSSDMKRKAIFAMSGHEFHALIKKIQSAYNSICKNNIQDSYLQPDACDKWLKTELDRRLPFQEKHVVQQASILGNLEMLGILRRPENVVHPMEHFVSTKESEHQEGGEGTESQFKLVEFGAGRGYLTHMLSDCYGIKSIVLVERRSYKFKADRTLRQMEAVNLERLRIDIEDLNLEAVESLKGFQYVAVGKHLCGPATDLALRCCLRGHNHHNNASEDTYAKGSHPFLKGLAIATCCHHLCQWKSYVNKSFFINLGFTKEEFHAVTWFTSWALDGEHRSDYSDGVKHRIDVPFCDTGEDPGDFYDSGDTIRCLNPADRAILGLTCKELLDTGRLMWLRQQGLNAKLVNYVPSKVSPENRLLLASKVENS